MTTRHIVMFKLRGAAGERRECAARFAEALNALPGVVPGLRSMEVGLNSNPAESWDVVLTATIDGGLEAVRAYAVHPAHLAAAAIVKPLCESRACVDYPLP